MIQFTSIFLLFSSKEDIEKNKFFSQSKCIWVFKISNWTLLFRKYNYVSIMMILDCLSDLQSKILASKIGTFMLTLFLALKSTKSLLRISLSWLLECSASKVIMESMKAKIFRTHKKDPNSKKKSRWTF